MNINGHYLPKPEADRRVEQIRSAVEKIEFDDPLRPYFDFLLGYIDDSAILIEEVDFNEKLAEMAKEESLKPYMELLAIKL